MGSVREGPTASTDEWKKKFEQGPKRSSSPAGRGICNKGEDCKLERPKNSAPAEKDSEAESEAGSEKQKKKAKPAPIIATESEAESACSWEDTVDSDAETECAPVTPKAKIYFPKKGRKSSRCVTFQEWVEYDDGDVSNQEFPERHYIQ